MAKRKLVLEDGTEFIGHSFGSKTIQSGEVIFNTGMTGYQEVISDPSYYGKIVVFTYPAIGSYGINRDDFEAIAPAVSGVVVKEVCDEPSNFRSDETLDNYLKKYDIPGISGIDTRMLTRTLRRKGSMKGILVDITDKNAVMQISESLSEQSLLKKVSISKPYIIPGRGKRIVVIDYGMKQSILHELTERGCHITVVPHYFTVDDIVPYKPDGVILSNGPGNPSVMKETIASVKSLIGKFPLFGIGLGHQFIALAYDAEIVKLPVGNFGSNFPVKNVLKDKTWITTKSNGFYVKENSLKGKDLIVTYRSLHDDKIDGLEHRGDVVCSVQFHPEGAPGSNETNYLFDEFLQKIEQFQTENGGYHHA